MDGWMIPHSHRQKGICISIKINNRTAYTYTFEGRDSPTGIITAWISIHLFLRFLEFNSSTALRSRLHF